MVENELAYLSAFDGLHDIPLGRFFPPVPIGVFSGWLQANTQPGDLIMDPLGANPAAGLEAARISRRVLFARNNPVTWLVLEALASSPNEIQIRSIVSKLLLSRQMGETLENRLKRIYETDCAECGRNIQPIGFIWEQNDTYPIAKVYTCPHCGDSGEKPANQYDFNRLERLGNIGLQRTRAIQKVVFGGEYEKESIETALDCYLPRAIYVTMLLVNRLDALTLNKAERRLLQAIMLSVFDDATSLWHWPEKDHRHLQLNVPSRFIEKNLWMSLENSARRWASEGPPVKISYWPKLPPSEGGICLYQRRLTENDNFAQTEIPTALIAVFPRPNQAFWTLSALWSGWLWGRKGIAPMRSALSRRHYDWRWFAEAISTSFKSSFIKTKTQKEIFCLFPNLTGNFLFGLLTGMHISGFKLTGAAFRGADELMQFQFMKEANNHNFDEFDLRSSILFFLNNVGEPVNFYSIILNCITEMAIGGFLPKQLDNMSESLFSQLQEKITTILGDEQFVRTYKSNLPGGSQWWLNNDQESKEPLSERVEIAIRDLLIDGKAINYQALEKNICGQFSGNLTPASELIHFCLESYADPSANDIHNYVLQTEESCTKRDADLNEMIQILSSLAKKLKFSQEKTSEFILWRNSEGEVTDRFYLTNTAVIANVILNAPSEEPLSSWIIFPGSRSRLMVYRIRHDPRLESAVENGWRLVKFRTLRRLAQQEQLSLVIWNDLISSDPPLWDPPVQFQLF